MSAYQLLKTEVRDFTEGMLARLRELNGRFPSQELANAIHRLEGLLVELREQEAAA